MTDLEEDTRQKLTQTWDAFTASIAETRSEFTAARAELASADASLMELVKALGDKLDAVDTTELPELHAQLNELSATMVQEQEGARAFVEESLLVRLPVATSAALQQKLKAQS